MGLKPLKFLKGTPLETLRMQILGALAFVLLIAFGLVYLYQPSEGAQDRAVREAVFSVANDLTKLSATSPALSVREYRRTMPTMPEGSPVEIQVNKYGDGTWCVYGYDAKAPLYDEDDPYMVNLLTGKSGQKVSGCAFGTTMELPG